MLRPATSSFKIDVPDAVAVSAKVDAPARSKPGAPALILAHGANNDLDHSLLVYVAAHLAATAGTTVLRFNFPYVERGAESPDPRALLETTYKLAYEHLVNELSPPGTPVFIGGKSLGGRVAAELVSRRDEGDGLAAVGLIELGYPLHAPGRSDRPNLAPIRHIDIPSLFCIGSRDPFCDLDLLRPLLPTLVRPGELYVVEGGDHSMHLPRSSGREPEDAYEAVAQRMATFIKSVAEG